MRDRYPCQGHDYETQKHAALAADLHRAQVWDDATEIYVCTEGHWHWRYVATPPALQRGPEGATNSAQELGEA